MRQNRLLVSIGFSCPGIVRSYAHLGVRCSPWYDIRPLRVHFVVHMINGFAQCWLSHPVFGISIFLCCDAVFAHFNSLSKPLKQISRLIFFWQGFLFLIDFFQDIGVKTFLINSFLFPIIHFLHFFKIFLIYLLFLFD